MYPNPQDALPLPPRPNLDHYKKLAKDLVKAANSDTLHAWATIWIASLIQRSNLNLAPNVPASATHWTTQLEQFVLREKASAKLTLTKSQFILARAHGFESWPKFSKHLAELARANTAVSNFERAAEAIVAGDLAGLSSLLRKHPDLIRARSTREHRATLLHYTAANGVEGYRQKSPLNTVAIAKLLLDAGAQVDATSDVYGGGATTLNLAATSIHPEQAGVQESLLDLLLQRGADLNQKDDRGMSTINACLANGRPRAANFLAARGAELDLESAAGVGRLDEVRKYFNEKGTLVGTTILQRARGLIWASEYGQNNVVEFLLRHGTDVHATANTGQTPLHCAVIGAHLDTIKLLLAHGADPETRNVYGGTALGQAEWCAEHSNTTAYTEVIAFLKNLKEKK
jgi:ankyrin repeat protein